MKEEIIYLTHNQVALAYKLFKNTAKDPEIPEGDFIEVVRIKNSREAKTLTLEVTNAERINQIVFPVNKDYPDCDCLVPYRLFNYYINGNDPDIIRTEGMTITYLGEKLIEREETYFCAGKKTRIVKIPYNEYFALDISAFAILNYPRTELLLSDIKSSSVVEYLVDFKMLQRRLIDIKPSVNAGYVRMVNKLGDAFLASTVAEKDYSSSYEGKIGIVKEGEVSEIGFKYDILKDLCSEIKSIDHHKELEFYIPKTNNSMLWTSMRGEGFSEYKFNSIFSISNKG